MTYKRVLLKLSGEALMGEKPYGIDPAIVQSIAEDVSTVVANNVQLAIVVGGGNIFRGLKGSADGMDRATADYVGPNVIGCCSIHAIGRAFKPPKNVASSNNYCELNIISYYCGYIFSY